MPGCPTVTRNRGARPLARQPFHFQEHRDNPRQRDLLAEQGAVITWVLALATALHSVLMPQYYELDTKRIAQWMVAGDVSSRDDG